MLWQYFSGREYYEHRPPCDPSQLSRFRKAIGEAGVEEILKASIDAAVQMKAIEPESFERVIVDIRCSPRPSPIRLTAGFWRLPEVSSSRRPRMWALR